MNKDKVKEIATDIITLWNKRDYKSRQYAVSKLKLSKWFLPVKTYNYLAEKMGGPLVPDLEDDDRTTTEKIDDENILRKAQRIFGGRIIE